MSTAIGIRVSLGICCSKRDLMSFYLRKSQSVKCLPRPPPRPPPSEICCFVLESYIVIDFQQKKAKIFIFVVGYEDQQSKGREIYTRNMSS